MIKLTGCFQFRLFDLFELVVFLLQFLHLEAKSFNLAHCLLRELLLESLDVKVDQRLHLCAAELAAVLGGVVDFTAASSDSPEISVLE